MVPLCLPESAPGSAPPPAQHQLIPRDGNGLLRRFPPHGLRRSKPARSPCAIASGVFSHRYPFSPWTTPSAEPLPSNQQRGRAHHRRFAHDHRRVIVQRRETPSGPRARTAPSAAARSPIKPVNSTSSVQPEFLRERLELGWRSGPFPHHEQSWNACPAILEHFTGAQHRIGVFLEVLLPRENQNRHAVRQAETGAAPPASRPPSAKTDRCRWASRRYRPYSRTTEHILRLPVDHPHLVAGGKTDDGYWTTALRSEVWSGWPLRNHHNTWSERWRPAARRRAWPAAAPRARPKTGCARAGYQTASLSQRR